MEQATQWVKMSELARRSGVPAATIKHYVREGLLPEPRRTSRNMAWYDAGLVDRIEIIKELQRTRFLPLHLIKRVLDERDAGDKTLAQALSAVLAESAPRKQRTRAELIAMGIPVEQLEQLRAIGVVEPEGGGDEEIYAGDDLAVLETLGAARKAGLTDDMLPIEILEPYLRTIRQLVRTELQLFREGVLPRAGEELPELVEVASDLSEKLVVQLRRKLLLPTLQQIVREETPDEGSSRETRRKRKPKTGGKR